MGGPCRAARPLSEQHYPTSMSPPPPGPQSLALRLRSCTGFISSLRVVTPRVVGTSALPDSAYGKKIEHGDTSVYVTKSGRSERQEATQRDLLPHLPRCVRAFLPQAPQAPARVGHATCLSGHEAAGFLPSAKPPPRTPQIWALDFWRDGGSHVLCISTSATN